MLGFLKHLLCKAPQNSTDYPQVEVTRKATAPLATVVRTQVRSTSWSKARPQQSAGGRGVKLSLQRILSCLPLELQPRVRQGDVGELKISIPLEKVLAQLSRGAVKVAFGELRQAAPGVFSPEEDRDRVFVTLPLGDIVPQLNPALMTRRRLQRQVEVPSEITSPFDASGQEPAVAITPVNPEPGPAVERQATTVTPGGPSRSVSNPARNGPVDIPAPPTGPSRGVLTSAPTPLPAGLPTTPLSGPEPPPAKVPAPSSDARGAAHPAADFNSSRNPAAEAGAGADGLLVPLSALAEGWPDAVRKEILDLNLVEAKVALPANEIEQALKQGRILVSWKALRFWLRPPLPPSVSPHDGTVLELPLRVVAPLFLGRQQAASKSKPQVELDDEIPNLFFGFPQPESEPSASAAPSKPPETNYYVWEDEQDTARVHESEVRRGPTPGTRFLAKYATPNEVVARAMNLDGVAGALVALPDGLMVASQLSADLNAETLAAFLPHIFGKVSQCTKELRMGELNNLNFTVGNVPWKIFRVHAIFFAAFGRAGKPLPTAQLAALATELDHKPK
jgi:predicted regulator of Ras-like GTPase activity (Roadblock/LC7/MglB family)